MPRMPPALVNESCARASNSHQEPGSCQQQASTTMARAARVRNRGHWSSGQGKRGCGKVPTWARPLGCLGPYLWLFRGTGLNEDALSAGKGSLDPHPGCLATHAHRARCRPWLVVLWHPPASRHCNTQRHSGTGLHCQGDQGPDGRGKIARGKVRSQGSRWEVDTSGLLEHLARLAQALTGGRARGGRLADICRARDQALRAAEALEA